MKKQFITRVFLSSLVLALTSLFGGGNLLAQTIDKLTADMFPATGTTYESFTNVKATSSAVYAGNSAKNTSGAIQLRSKNSNSGIVTTTSGGKVTKIVLEWKSTSDNAGRTIEVYGKSSPYKSAAELYNTSSTSTQGTKIGSIEYDGESTTTTLVFKDDNQYEYIGLRSKSGALYLNSVEITWASSGGSGGSEETTKKDPKLAYKPSSCTVIVGETPELPTLSYADGVTGIVYASSNTAVATVNETTGAVTLTGAEGTTVISATLEDNATFANGFASYELTVTKSKTYRYKKVTATEELMDGGQYIIVCEDLNLAKGPGKETGSVEVNIVGGMIVPAESAALGVYTLKAMVGGYALKFGESDYLCSEGAKETGFSSKDTPVAWTVTIDKNGNAFIQCSESDSRQILFSGTNCKNYASSNVGYNKVQLYQKVYPLTVSSATGGYATFYNEEEAYQMPAGLTGYAVTTAENGHFITRKTAYEAGATVPAKTPLLIIGTTDGGNYYPAVVSGTGVEAYAGSNLLEGTRDVNGKTLSDNDGDVYYYKLGLNAEKVPGFYWGAENGAAFKMTKATTAYLAVPKTMANGANALFFDFGGETGINEIQTEQADKAIFDLSGRRVKKATKGFYIVGGKKVLVK